MTSVKRANSGVAGGVFHVCPFQHRAAIWRLYRLCGGTKKQHERIGDRSRAQQSEQLQIVVRINAIPAKPIADLWPTQIGQPLLEKKRQFVMLSFPPLPVGGPEAGTGSTS